MTGSSVSRAHAREAARPARGELLEAPSALAELALEVAARQAAPATRTHV